jgi:hypothetical protein
MTDGAGAIRIPDDVHVYSWPVPWHVFCIWNHTSKLLPEHVSELLFLICDTESKVRYLELVYFHVLGVTYVNMR